MQKIYMQLTISLDIEYRELTGRFEKFGKDLRLALVPTFFFLEGFVDKKKVQDIYLLLNLHPGIENCFYPYLDIIDPKSLVGRDNLFIVNYKTPLKLKFSFSGKSQLYKGKVFRHFLLKDKKPNTLIKSDNLIVDIINNLHSSLKNKKEIYEPDNI